MPIDSYTQYQTLTRSGPLAPGDLLLKKIFTETRTHVIEWAITSGQRLFEGDQTVKTGGLFSREKFRVKYQGSHTSEHAAIALSADELAEAIGEGVITGSVRSRRAERYIVYRCQNAELTKAAVVMAKGLSSAYHNVITGTGGRITTGGAYSTRGALESGVGWHQKTFSQTTTNQFLTHVIDYVQGVRQDRPNMFCSQFAATVYEAGSLAAFGKTAMGTNPMAMSPMELENVINGRPDLFHMIGRYDSDNDALYSAVRKGLARYSDRWHFNRSGASKNAVTILRNLMEIGDNDYLLAAVAALLNTQPTTPTSLKCNIPSSSRLATKSSLYRDMVVAMKPTGLLAL